MFAFNLEFINRMIFFADEDRIGPDMLSTHWRLYFKSTMTRLCRRKFKYFHKTAEFRPGAYAIYCSKISIGKRVIIRPNTMLFADIDGEIHIGDNVMIGSGAHIYVRNHRFDHVNTPIIDQGYYPSKSVTIHNGAWIGANVIILPGVTIGENSVVGAGSVVTKNVPSQTVVAGNPAKIIKKLHEK